MALEELGGPASLEPGDVILSNNPHYTGGQPVDLAVFQAIFWDDEIIGYAAIRGHMGDLGGKNLYPIDATEVFQEGVVFPPVRLRTAAGFNEDIFRTIAMNSRMPKETVGSIRGAVASVGVAVDAVGKLVREYGLDTYRRTVAELLDHGERFARRAIAQIPDGTYIVERNLDSNGFDDKPVPLRCSVRVEGTDVTVDLTGSAPQQVGSANCPQAYVTSACRFALKRVISPTLPASSGESRPLRIINPSDSIFAPRWPAATWTAPFTAIRLSDMVMSAFAQALPERLPAENAGDLMQFIALLTDPQTGRLSLFADLGMLGHGAAKGHDGLSATLHAVAAGCLNIPTELIENRMPVRKRRFELVADSGGPGEFRGGLATVAEIEILGDGASTTQADKHSAARVEGLAGGRPAPFTNSITLFPGTAEERVLGKAAGVEVRSGDRVLVAPAGGGGWGDPLSRAVGRVAADVKEGYVTTEAARREYGVVVGPDGIVDTAATRALREASRTEGAE